MEINSIMKAKFIFLILLAVNLSSLVAMDKDQRCLKLNLPFMKKAPAIDGNIIDAEWSVSGRIKNFCYNDGYLHPGKIDIWLGSDGKSLFIAAKSELPIGQMLSRISPMDNGGDSDVFYDDNLEIFIKPESNDSESTRVSHAMFNAKCAVFDELIDAKGNRDLSWRGNWSLASSLKNGYWNLEVAVPLKDLGVNSTDGGLAIKMNMIRNWRQTDKADNKSFLSPSCKNFCDSNDYAEISFKKNSPVACIEQLKKSESENLELLISVFNPGSTPANTSVFIDNVPESSTAASLKHSIQVPPGKTEKVVFTHPNIDKQEKLHTAVRVKSEDGKTLFARDFYWWLKNQKSLFKTTSKEADMLGVAFAYYPYSNIMKVNVDLKGLLQRDQVKDVKLELRPHWQLPGQNKPIAETVMPPLKNYKTSLEWKVPSLAQYTTLQEKSSSSSASTVADYQLIIKCEGIECAPIQKDFVRYVFPWEGNLYGKSDAIVPPFSPIKLDKENLKLDTVLRSHKLNPMGLWDQVESLGMSLLSSPIHLEFETENGSSNAEGNDFKFDEIKPGSVKTSGKWTAGVFRGQSNAEWDYDGMMLWHLTINPCNEKINFMRLIIEIDDNKAPMMHAVTDGLRFNYAGNIPPGQGKIWDGNQAVKSYLKGSYVPYIWFGAEERGICVFGESDLGWETSEAVPCQEVFRENGRLKLVLNLIAKPVVLREKRNITIGFQATPVKPMPKDWRLWENIWGGWRAPETIRKNFVKTIDFIGSCVGWGCVGPCNEIYPRDGDMRILGELGKTKRTGNIDKAFIEQWISGYRINGNTEEEREKQIAQYRHYITSAFNKMKRHPENVIFYTNATGCRLDTPEGQTFIDEWHRDAFVTRKWGYGSGVAYMLDNTPSFQDYAAWYYKQLLESGACDGIYWDNMFPLPVYNTVGSAAYEDGNGEIHPAVNILNKRALVKRTAILSYELGKENLNMPHMTNTTVVPFLSFASFQYDWEWHGRTDKDFQDRVSRDYIRAASLGLKTGNVPVMMVCIKGPAASKPKEKDWIERTAAGVCLSHELKINSSSEHYWGNYKRMLEYGYGKNEVTISQYWCKDYPVKISGGETSSLLLSKLGSALIVVCDYSNGGDYTLKFDSKSLKLPPKIKAVDMETAKELEVDASGNVHFALPKHDFKMILLNSE
jgi:hypothetical protein